MAMSVKRIQVILQKCSRWRSERIDSSPAPGDGGQFLEGEGCGRVVSGRGCSGGASRNVRELGWGQEDRRKVFGQEGNGHGASKEIR